MELKCQVQQYAWGKVGTKSSVALFAANGRPDDFCVDGTAPYAELWMGTHPNGPSRLAGIGSKTLEEHIATNPKMLGDESRKKFGDTLPYLFKILSVNKALSIQAHPDKQHAEQLHKSHPEIYKDANHKPEMAIALTDFQGLCGFRPLSQIQAHLKSVPELAKVIGKVATDDLMKTTPKGNNYQVALKNAFTALMKCDKAVIKTQLASLKASIEAKTCHTSIEKLFLDLQWDFKDDVGCFVIYFLNHVQLSPGEAMFLGPNLPHAYLSGDCVECMACSDNVVRAGLTPKLIDVPTLCEMLNYTCPDDDKVDDVKFKPVKEDKQGLSVLYDAPVPDFSVAQLNGPMGKTARFPGRKSASIVIVVDCIQGSYQAFKQDGKTAYAGGKVKKGIVLFLEANDVVEFTAEKEPVLAYQSFC